MLASLFQLSKWMLMILRVFASWRAKSAEAKHVHWDGKLAKLESPPTGKTIDPQGLIKMYRYAQQSEGMLKNVDKAVRAFDKWDSRATRLNAKIQSLRNWSGRKTPYLAGALDMGLGFAAVCWATGHDITPVIQALAAIAGRLPAL